MALDRERLDFDMLNEVRRSLKTHASKIGTCDGTDKELIRKWLRGIDHAKKCTAATDKLTFELVGFTTNGSLGDFYTEQTAALQDPNKTWAHLRGLIVTSYLGPHEKRHLRDKLEKLRQEPFEEIEDFNRRFTELMQQAYTVEQRGQDLLKERLPQIYITGLNDKSLRSHVYLTYPTDVEDAMKSAAEAAVAIQLAEDTNGHQEVAAMPQAKETDPELKHILKSLQKEVKSLTINMQKKDSPATTQVAATSVSTQPTEIAAVQQQQQQQQQQQPLHHQQQQSWGNGYHQQPQAAYNGYQQHPQPMYNRPPHARPSPQSSNAPVYNYYYGNNKPNNEQVRGRGRGRGNGSNRSRGRQRAANNNMPYRNACWSCGKLGHASYECPQNLDPRQQLDHVIQAAMEADDYYYEEEYPAYPAQEQGNY